jgi:hypothetical protein
MTKSELLELAYPLGKHVNKYTNELAEKGYQLPKFFQEYAYSFAENDAQKNVLKHYWAERAMEEFASTHARYNPFNGIYPENYLYMSDLIKKLRADYSGKGNLDPILKKMDENVLSNEITRNSLREKIRQHIDTELLVHNIIDIPSFYEVDFSQKKELLLLTFIKLGEDLGYKLDKVRSSKDFPVLTLNYDNIDICCFIATIIRYEIRSVNTYMALIPKNVTTKVKTLYKTLNQESPFVDLKPIFLAPGFEYYYWIPKEIKDVLLSIKASLELFKLVGKDIE